jgi:hypothetical protein
MNGVFERFGLKVGKEKTVGTATISAYEYKDKDNPLFNLRAIRDGGSMFMMDDGKYIRLAINNELVMSDTRMEKTSNSEFVRCANGNVLMVGLGIGLTLHNLEDKMNSDEIKKITVIEKNKDVINLISLYYPNPKIEIIHNDIYNWAPKKNEKFDTIYFDIWSDINVDNLKQIKILHNKFKNKLNRKNPKCWMNSWMKEYLQDQRRRERNNIWY